MFLTFVFSEIKNALKQPMVYIFFTLITLLVFGATVSDNITIGGSVGNVYRNAPFVITMFTSILSIFGLLMATAFFNNAALRDFNHGFHEILFSTPIGKFGFFFGRFSGALFLSTIPLLGVFAGVILGSFLGPILGWVDADRFGSFYIATFVNNYLLFILPNMFIAGAIIFALASKWKSTVIAFVGALVIIVAYMVSGELLSDLESETLGAISDAFGIRTYGLSAKYFTSVEKNTLSPQFNGLLLLNRSFWIFIGVVVLSISYFSFSFQVKNKNVKRQKKQKKEEELIDHLPDATPSFNRASIWIQFVSFFQINFYSITRSVTFKILFLFSSILIITNLVGGFEYFGLQSYPMTYKMIDLISNNSSIFIVIILVFFSGELIWRDRESRINEVVDATSHTTIVSLLAKWLSLVSIVTFIHFTFVLVGVIYQLASGYTHLELDLYLLDFLYLSLPIYLTWCGVMIFVQTLIKNKYVGYFISILLLFIWELIMMALDIQTNMLQIGQGPHVIYSDMNSFGPALKGTLWFKVYWLLFAFLCVLFSAVIYKRGADSSLLSRIKKVPKVYTKGFSLFTGCVLVVWLLVTGFVFYNTQVLNTYKTSDELEDLQVEYELKYKKYEHVPLPKIVDAKYFIDLFPYKRDVKVTAKLKYTNQTNVPIDSIHYSFDSKWNPEFIIPNASLVYEDRKLEYLIFKLNTPLQPGDTIDVEINTSYITKGFENNISNTGIVNNGSFLNNFQVLPALGYASDAEISDKNTRKKHGLKLKSRVPKLQTDSCARGANYLTDGKSDFMNVETVISTAGDQIAIAPGSLIKQWKEDGRNYYNYKVDHTSLNFFSFTSAKFEVAKRKWNDVDLEIYYDKKHEVNVEMMLDAVERSLTYYTEQFGPYYHKQCRVVEFPRYSTFAQSFPGTMPYSESIGFIINLEDENDNNIVDAVIAHEIAHQWWAHQVIGANMQGATLMSESLAEYSSLMTMKHISKKPAKMREFLKYDHDRYLRGRSRETDKELPLYKVENQNYIHYGKGSLILYALQDYIGEGKVNTAMRNFLEEYRYKKPPYPTSLDFIRYLEPQVPDSFKYLINDWFKEITLYDNRVKEATYEKQENGKYLASIDIESYKIKADTIGNETKVGIDDWIDIGFFADDQEEDLLFEKRVKIDQAQMSFSFVLDTIPVKAAIDPRHLLIDRVYDDNSKSVALTE